MLQIIFNKIQASQARKNRFSFHVASFTDQFMSTCTAVRWGNIFYNSSSHSMGVWSRTFYQAGIVGVSFVLSSLLSAILSLQFRRELWPVVFLHLMIYVLIHHEGVVKLVRPYCKYHRKFVVAFDCRKQFVCFDSGLKFQASILIPL